MDDIDDDDEYGHAAWKREMAREGPLVPGSLSCGDICCDGASSPSRSIYCIMLNNTLSCNKCYNGLHPTHTAQNATDIGALPFGK